MKNEYELNAVRGAYRFIKMLCYECEEDCKNCKIGKIREQIVELEKMYSFED